MHRTGGDWSFAMSTAIALDWQPTDIGYLPTTQPGLRTLIVGAGQAGRALARDLKHVGSFGLAPIGFLDDHRDRQVVRRLPVLGTLEDLLSVATTQRSKWWSWPSQACRGQRCVTWRPPRRGLARAFVTFRRSWLSCNATWSAPTCATCRSAP